MQDPRRTHAERLVCGLGSDGGRLASGSYDNTVKIWDAIQGSLLWTLEVASMAREVAWRDTDRLAVATEAGIVELWHIGDEPRRLARLYEAAPVTGLVVTEDGYVDGPPSALDNVRFADGWALYDLNDLPERHSPERVRGALAYPNATEISSTRQVSDPLTL